MANLQRQQATGLATLGVHMRSRHPPSARPLATTPHPMGGMTENSAHSGKTQPSVTTGPLADVTNLVVAARTSAPGLPAGGKGLTPLAKSAVASPMTSEGTPPEIGASLR